MRNAALYTAAVIFAIGCVAHVVRLITKFEIVIAGNVLPQSVSIAGAIVAGLLALWMLAAARSG